MTDKTVVLRAFNKHLFDFLDDVIGIFPENMDIKASKTSFEFYKKANPTLLVKIWYSYIYQPYAEIIDSGDLEFFINKDYSEDLSYLPNSKDILKSIEGLRDQIKEMSDVNRAHSLEYIQNLCKLSNMYNNLTNMWIEINKLTTAMATASFAFLLFPYFFWFILFTST